MFYGTHQVNVSFDHYVYMVVRGQCFVMSFGTYTKIGTIQRRLAWPLRKDDTQIREAFQIFEQFISQLGSDVRGRFSNIGF